ILKVMNKIGISTLNSYRGSQLFECIGLNSNFVNTFFPNTVTRIQGIGLREIEKEIHKRHQKAYFEKSVDAELGLEFGGNYKWRTMAKNTLSIHCPLQNCRNRFEIISMPLLRNILIW